MIENIWGDSLKLNSFEWKQSVKKIDRNTANWKHRAVLNMKVRKASHHHNIYWFLMFTIGARQELTPVWLRRSHPRVDRAKGLSEVLRHHVLGRQFLLRIQFRYELPRHWSKLGVGQMVCEEWVILSLSRYLGNCWLYYLRCICQFCRQNKALLGLEVRPLGSTRLPSLPRTLIWMVWYDGAVERIQPSLPRRLSATKKAVTRKEKIEKDDPILPDNDANYILSPDRPPPKKHHRRT